jgi:hypothetical protein
MVSSPITANIMHPLILSYQGMQYLMGVKNMDIVRDTRVYKKFFNGKLLIVRVKQIVVKDKRGFTKIEDETEETVYGG